MSPKITSATALAISVIALILALVNRNRGEIHLEDRATGTAAVIEAEAIELRDGNKSTLITAGGVTLKEHDHTMTIVPSSLHSYASTSKSIVSAQGLWIGRVENGEDVGEPTTYRLAPDPGQANLPATP